MTNSPTVWRRWLAFELRRLREERSLSQRQVGKSCGWSGARLSYIENLLQNVVDDDLAQLLPLYEVPKDRWDDFYEAARRAREQGFWERYDQRVIPDWLTLYVGLEQGASSIHWVETLCVPALLQTPEYATATIQTDVVPRTDQQIARMVELRMARQAVLIRGEGPLQLSVIMDESVLYRVTGSSQIMAEQLDHLARAVDRANVTLKIFPFTLGVNHCLVAAYKILTFPDRSDSGMVYIEHREGASYLEDEEEVDTHTHTHTLAFEHLSTLALPAEESLARLRQVAELYADDRHPHVSWERTNDPPKLLVYQCICA